MIETDLLEKTHLFVAHLLPTNGSDQANSHTLEHTKTLVAVAEQIGKAAGLGEHDMHLLLLAAWLHDLSFAIPDTPPAADKAAQFLESTGLSEAEIRTIQQGIAAARFPQHPQNLLEEVLCDAVASFLAANDYFEREQKKAGITPGATSQELQWISAQRALLKKHTYFTDFARHTYAAGKEKNLKRLKKRREELMRRNPELQALLDKNEKLQKNLQKGKEQKSLKGVETLFRTTMASHLQLSAIADSKANIMISINAIIGSIMISSFIRSFADVPHLMIPAFVLTVVCMLTTIIAVLATRPNIRPTAPVSGKMDFLFFADYTRLSADDYRAGMREIIQDPDRLYNSMIDNIYRQGKVLEKKYRLLKLSYTVFVIGLGLVLASYAVAWFYFTP